MKYHRAHLLFVFNLINILICCLLQPLLMEQYIFFTLSLNIEGATEMALQFIMLLKPIYTKNIGFAEQKRLKRKQKLKWHFSCCLPLKSCPPRLMFVLHKDTLFR
jgi:hypothetical protein